MEQIVTSEQRLKRLNVVLIRSPKRVDVAAPEVTGSHNIRATPCERRLPSLHDNIRHKPGMATVAVSEGMNPNKPMVKPDSELVRFEGLMSTQ